MIKLRFGNGTQLARVEGESKNGKHWLIRRIYSSRGTLYKKTSKIKKDDHRILEINEVTPEYFNALKIEKSYSYGGHWNDCKGCKFCKS